MSLASTNEEALDAASRLLGIESTTHHGLAVTLDDGTMALPSEDCWQPLIWQKLLTAASLACTPLTEDWPPKHIVQALCWELGSLHHRVFHDAF